MSDLTIGTMTKYGRIIEKQFGDGFELIPEYVFHHPDLPNLKLNQFAFDNGNPWEFEAWCTQNGQWDGPRKLRTMKLVDGGVYPEFILLETNFEVDNTVGVVGPLVCVLNNEQFVAVNMSKNRRGGKVAEAMRQRHGSLDAKPKAIDSLRMVLTEYGTDKIGLLLTNTACIHGETQSGEIRLALVRGELTVASNVEQLPALNAPFEWIPLEQYMFLMDDHGQAVIGRAILAGYLKKPTLKKVRKVLKKLPAFVATQCK